MMTLKLMRSIIDGTTRMDGGPIATQLAALWDGDQARLMRASANFIFQFQKQGQPYILRFNHAIERRLDHLKAEIDYLLYLAAQGIPIAKPIPSLNGHFIETLSTEDGEFHAVAFEALSGAS